MRNIADSERGYAIAIAKLKMMNAEQRIRFEIIFADWKNRKGSWAAEQDKLRAK